VEKALKVRVAVLGNSFLEKADEIWQNRTAAGILKGDQVKYTGPMSMIWARFFFFFLLKFFLE
jgi:hypothetical protein